MVEWWGMILWDYEDEHAISQGSCRQNKVWELSAAMVCHHPWHPCVSVNYHIHGHCQLLSAEEIEVENKVPSDKEPEIPSTGVTWRDLTLGASFLLEGRIVFSPLSWKGSVDYIGFYLKSGKFNFIGIHVSQGNLFLSQLFNHVRECDTADHTNSG